MTTYQNGRTMRERILSRLIIDIENGCLLWTGHRAKDGYGRVMVGTGKPDYVHRVVYQMFQGAIPEGTELDHLCRNTSCASPAHLEPVTHLVNMRRWMDARKAGR